MIEKKIYIAIEFGGQYEDSWRSNLAASFSKQEIENFIEIKKLEKKDRNDLISKIVQLHKTFKDSNPGPIHPNMPAIPEWPAGLPKKLITKEMRDERNTIQGERNRLQQEYGQAWQTWMLKWVTFKNQFLINLGVPADKVIEYPDHLAWDDSDFDVEEISFLE